MVDFDTDVLLSPGFVILAVMAIGATILGYIFTAKSDMDTLKIWQLLVIIVVELMACYWFAAKG